jgi:hypothetical protein
MARSFENIPKNPSKNDITPHSSARAGAFLPNVILFTLAKPMLENKQK